MQKQQELPEAFAGLGIEVRFLKALRKMGFTKPTDIQEAMIPLALEGRDILGQARTGTGKTAAFGLPILQQLDPAARLQAICLAPTRELAVQVTAELQRLAEFTPLHVVAVYGGQKVSTQLHQLGRKPHFVVGTPGRVLDFLRRGTLKIEDCRFVVLDEVDRMLDIGFRDDIKAILSRVTGPHQTILVSATIEQDIKRLAAQFMAKPAEVNVSRDRLTVEEVDQFYVTAERHDKFRALRLLLKQEAPQFAIVFCNTKAATRKLAKKLYEAGVDAKEIHGDLMQRQRDRVMDQFRKHKIKVLVATDLAARGIDISAISHIINYDIPEDAEAYVHRIGRTARMGARGVAITLVGKEEGQRLTNVEMLINREIPQHIVEGFKPSAPTP
ncbi:MAG: DEAD/DEAH box helicase, partial [Planctomycetes bacterium]|nr:DEAD/DEAH box helicase [Planctomycetota bacterium]